MEPWIPLLQTLVWPILIGFSLCLYHSKISAILDAIKIRITQGDDVSAGGFSLKKPEALAKELIEASRQNKPEEQQKPPQEQKEQIENLSAQLDRVEFLVVHGRLQHQGEIEEERALLERLAYQATYDPLTHLYSRAYFNIASESLLHRAIEKKTKLAFVFFDLDSFKMINDAKGHHFGDKVLMAVATRLRETIPKEVLARIGGDEFVTVLEYIDLNKLKSRLRELIEAMSTPLLIGEEEIHISTSIGVSLYPQHGSTKEDLLLRSDEAMYRAKKQSRGTYVIFSETT